MEIFLKKNIEIHEYTYMNIFIIFKYNILIIFNLNKLWTNVDTKPTDKTDILNKTNLGLLLDHIIFILYYDVSSGTIITIIIIFKLPYTASSRMNW